MSRSENAFFLSFIVVLYNAAIQNGDIERALVNAIALLLG